MGCYFLFLIPPSNLILLLTYSSTYQSEIKNSRQGWVKHWKTKTKNWKKFDDGASEGASEGAKWKTYPSWIKYGKKFILWIYIEFDENFDSRMKNKCSTCFPAVYFRQTITQKRLRSSLIVGRDEEIIPLCPPPFQKKCYFQFGSDMCTISDGHCLSAEALMKIGRSVGR